MPVTPDSVKERAGATEPTEPVAVTPDKLNERAPRVTVPTEPVPVTPDSVKDLEAATVPTEPVPVTADRTCTGVTVPTEPVLVTPDKAKERAPRVTVPTEPVAVTADKVTFTLGLAAPNNAANGVVENADKPNMTTAPVKLRYVKKRGTSSVSRHNKCKSTSSNCLIPKCMDANRIFSSYCIVIN